jgi:hypothetical protein
MAIGDGAVVAEAIQDYVIGDDVDNYEILVGNRLYTLKEFDETLVSGQGKQGQNCVDITDVVNATLGHINISTSYTTHKPCGKNKSFNTISSKKVTPTGRDFDTKSYTGGGLPLKTYTYPDTITHSILGENGIVKNVQAGGTFSSKGELDIVANNFYEMNQLLAQLTITTRGFLSVNEVSRVLNMQDFIIDKITYDYASNGTVINGRAIID